MGLSFGWRVTRERKEAKKREKKEREKEIQYKQRERSGARGITRRDFYQKRALR